MTNTEVEPDAPATGEVVPMVPDLKTSELVPLTPELVKAWLDGDDIPEDDDTDELDYETAVKILGAKDAAGVLTPDDVRESKTLAGTNFVVQSVTWRKSTKRADGKGRYALMRCVDADGVPFLVSCGATKVMLQLRRAQLDGWFPWRVSMIASDTASGNTVYELAAPGEDF